MRRELESLSGIGTLYEGDKRLGETHYHVNVSQKMLEGQIPGLQRIEGSIVKSDVDLFDIINRNAPITLHLQDGRRWDCWLQSTDGNLVNRGDGLYRP